MEGLTCTAAVHHRKSSGWHKEHTQARHGQYSHFLGAALIGPGWLLRGLAALMVRPSSDGALHSRLDPLDQAFKVYH